MDLTLLCPAGAGGRAHRGSLRGSPGTLGPCPAAGSRSPFPCPQRWGSGPGRQRGPPCCECCAGTAPGAGCACGRGGTAAASPAPAAASGERDAGGVVGLHHLHLALSQGPQAVPYPVSAAGRRRQPTCAPGSPAPPPRPRAGIWAGWPSSSAPWPTASRRPPPPCPAAGLGPRKPRTMPLSALGTLCCTLLPSSFGFLSSRK